MVNGQWKRSPSGVMTRLRREKSFGFSRLEPSYAVENDETNCNPRSKIFYEKIYPELYEEEYGYFRKIITATICKYLDCRITENGFAFPLLAFKLKKGQPLIEITKTGKPGISPWIPCSHQIEQKNIATNLFLLVDLDAVEHRISIWKICHAEIADLFQQRPRNS